MTGFRSKRSGATVFQNTICYSTIVALGALAVVTLTAPASAQSWPQRPVTLIVPFPAGGGTDAFARPLAAQLDKQFKGTPYLFISSVANQGLTELKDKLWEMLNVADEEVENSHGI